MRVQTVSAIAISLTFCVVVAGSKTPLTFERADTSSLRGVAVITSSDAPPTPPQSRQQAYCITGYIMDSFCIGLQTLLDRPDLISLQYPDEHSVHCLVEVSSCVQSGYEVLSPPGEVGANYTRTVKLDKKGNQLVYDLARLTGICGSCGGNGSILKGFRATVTGVLTGSGNPPTLAVDQVVPATVSCSSLVEQQPPPPPPAPTLKPNPPPTVTPTKSPVVPTLLPTKALVTSTNAPVAPTKAPVVSPTVKPSGPQITTIKYPSGLCFSETNTVQVEAKKTISIKDLQIGDLVKDANGNMVRVYSFGHYQPNVKTNYLQLHAKGLVRPLEVSRDHLVFVRRATTAIPASLVSVGDYLQMEQGGKGGDYAEVTSIQEVNRAGAYAPFTLSGTILVNGVAASSYVTLQPDMSVLSIGKYSTWLPMHWLAYIFESPHRMVCRWNMNVCHVETYTPHGISTWVYKPMLACQWFLEQNNMIMIIMFLPAVSLGLLFYAMEQACLYGFWLVVLLAVPLVAILRVWPSTKKVRMV